MITQSKLKKILSYDRNTGDFTWVNRGLNSRLNGKIAGGLSRGYTVICIHGINYRAHRLVFLYLYGDLPPDVVDHINGVKNDNRRANLRRVSSAVNQKNLPKYKTNLSGFTGVHFCKSRDKWRSTINVNGKVKSLGYFKYKEDAIITRKSAEVEFGYHKNHGRLA